MAALTVAGAAAAGGGAGAGQRGLSAVLQSRRTGGDGTRAQK